MKSSHRRSPGRVTTAPPVHAPRIARRCAVTWLAVGAASPQLAARALAAQPAHPQRKWYLRAEQMRSLAEAWGDQSYGAVVVLGDTEVGQGPSRVVRDRDPDAHAERVAIGDAQRALGRQTLAGAVLYSTSRPCSLCEAAAARAGISRMYHGSALNDAGAPRLVVLRRTDRG